MAATLLVFVAAVPTPAPGGAGPPARGVAEHERVRDAEALLGFGLDGAFRRKLTAALFAPSEAERLRSFAAFPEIEPAPIDRERVGRHVVAQFLFWFVEEGTVDIHGAAPAVPKVTGLMMRYFPVDTRDVLDVLVPYLGHEDKLVRDTAEYMILAARGLDQENFDWHRGKFMPAARHFRTSNKMDPTAPDFPWAFVRKLYGSDAEAALNTMIDLFAPDMPKDEKRRLDYAVMRVAGERRLVARWGFMEGVSPDPEVEALLEWLSRSPHWFVKRYVLSVMMAQEPGDTRPWFRADVMRRLAEDDNPEIRRDAARLLRLVELGYDPTTRPGAGK